jgi:hypothetical protein
MPAPRFIDDVDAQRQLGVDRLTLEGLVRSKRLRPVSATKEGHYFFRATDIARLRGELYPDSEAEGVSDGSPAEDASAAAPAAPAQPAKKKHDPAMRVHLRLTADLKWYDISDADLQAWLDQLGSDAYDRQRANARYVISRMERIIALIDQAGAPKAAGE